MEEWSSGDFSIFTFFIVADLFGASSTAMIVMDLKCFNEN
jgi:hypothetical protein